MNKSAYIEWDVVNWGRALAFWKEKLPFDLKGVKALEIGGRYGGLSLWLAEQGADVLCTDINEIVPQQRMHAGEDLPGTIQYQTLDALKMNYKEEFDLVVFKSVLGGIGRNGHPERQRKAINNMYQALKPGGVLLFAENLAGSPLHRYLRQKFVRWGKEWRYVTIREMLEYMEIFSCVQTKKAGFLGAFGRTETIRNILGYIDIVTDWIFPGPWRYIIFGVAVK